MTKSALFLTCALGAFSGMAGVATAQTAAPTSAAPAATEVGAVIVTAEKRSQNLQKVPVAVTAFTSKQRDTVGIETLQDMTNFAPGLTYTSTTDHLYVRGVGRQSINLAADAGVASYTDGFYNPDPVLIVLPPMFIGSTEVLRGPQGTLQGRNGIAGALLVESKRPTSTPYAEGRVTLGNYGVNNYEAAISGPLADGLNFRLAAFDENQNDGYFKNVAGGSSEGGLVHTWYIEGMVSAKLGDNTDFFAKVFTFGNNSSGGPGARAGWDRTPYSTNYNDYSSNLSFNPAGGYNAGIVPGSLLQTNPAITGNPATANPYDFSGSFYQQIKNHDDGDINYILTHHFGGMDLKYTGGYQQYTYQNIESSETFGQQTDVLSYQVPGLFNPSCAAVGPKCLTINPELVTNYIQNDAWYSHEVTLASTDHGPLQWIGGLYYYHEQFSNPVYTNMPMQNEVATPYEYTGTLPLVHAAPDPNRNLYYSDYNLQAESKAVFGQVDYKVTDAIKLTAGLRYTDDRKWGTEDYRLVTFGGSVIENSPLALLATPQYSGLVGAYAPGSTTLPAIDLTNQLCNPIATPIGHGAVSACTINAATGIASRELNATSSATTGTAGVEWTPDNSTLGYFRYSRGYKEVGLNAGTLANNAEVAPEHMDDFEAGLKKTFGRNLVVDLAVFYENYIDAQFPVNVYSTGTGGTTTVSSEFLSIPKSRSDGVELETIWTPISHLQFLVSYAYNDTAFETHNRYVDTVNPNLGAQSINGNPMPNAPKNKVSFNTQYTLVFDSGDLTFSGTYLWRDTQTGAIFNQSYWQAPSWSQVDLRATWRGVGDKYEVALFGRNVFNTTGYPSGPDAYQYGNAAQGLGSPAHPAAYTIGTTYTTNPPATYGVEFHYKFF